MRVCVYVGGCAGGRVRKIFAKKFAKKKIISTFVVY